MTNIPITQNLSYLVWEEHSLHTKLSALYSGGHLNVLWYIDSVPMTFDLGNIGMKKRLPCLHDPHIDLVRADSEQDVPTIIGSM